MTKCKWCGKKLIKRQEVFCSVVCKRKYFIENKIGPWYNSKQQSKMGRRGGVIGGKIAQKTLKKLMVSAFYNKKIQRSNGNKSAKTNKKNKTGFWDSKIGKKGAISVNKKYPELAKIRGKLGGKIGGLAAQHILRFNIRNLKYKNQQYDSNPEREVSICLQEQHAYNPKENKTLHIRIGQCEYDYLLEKLKLFIEYHPWFQNVTEQEYYNKRRENLNENGYKNYKLVVIK